MKSTHLTRRIALVAGGAAIVGMGTLTAGCSTSTKEAPSTSTAPSASSSAPAATSTSPEMSSTEKVITQQPVVPSIEQRGPMDATSCGPGMSKVNGVCQ